MKRKNKSEIRSRRRKEKESDSDKGSCGCPKTDNFTRPNWLLTSNQMIGFHMVPTYQTILCQIPGDSNLHSLHQSIIFSMFHCYFGSKYHPNHFVFTFNQNRISNSATI
jgi:hypothetical protein